MQPNLFFTHRRSAAFEVGIHPYNDDILYLSYYDGICRLQISLDNSSFLCCLIYCFEGTVIDARLINTYFLNKEGILLRFCRLIN